MQGETAWPWTYSDDEITAIADSISVAESTVEDIRPRLNNLAGWYRLDNFQETIFLVSEETLCSGSGKPALTPRERREREKITLLKLQKIKDSTDELISLLEQGDSVEELMRVIGDEEAGILQNEEDTLINAVGFLYKIANWSDKAVENLTSDGSTGRDADTVINEWIYEICALYRLINARPFGTSTGGAGTKNEGVASGPVVRFVLACAKPVDIQLSEDAIRARIRRLNIETE
jgi:hypothetical protein